MMPETSFTGAPWPALALFTTSLIEEIMSLAEAEAVCRLVTVVKADE